MTELIFMLTHHDVTIPNAHEVFEEVKESAVRFVGCKDIGLSTEKLHELFRKMKDAGKSTFLEVVSYDEQKHFEGVEKAIRIKADFLIGGMPDFAKKTIDLLKKRRVNAKFFPYVGRVTGHPCVLKGTVEEIVKQAEEFEKMGVDGINLLLYRYNGNAKVLLRRMTESLRIPLLPAGSIDSLEKVEEMKRKKVFAFTIGGAILEKKFAPNKSIEDQIDTVLNRLHST